jgi:hypothetical protein
MVAGGLSTSVPPVRRLEHQLVGAVRLPWWDGLPRWTTVHPASHGDSESLPIRVVAGSRSLRLWTIAAFVRG